MEIFFLFGVPSHRWYSLTFSVYHDQSDKPGLLLRLVTLEPRKQINHQLCIFRLGMEPAADVRSALWLRAAWRNHNQAGACDGVWSQCSHLSFECSAVLSHVCGHVARVGGKKRQTNKWVLKHAEFRCSVFWFCFYSHFIDTCWAENLTLRSGLCVFSRLFLILLRKFLLKQIHAFCCTCM